MKCKSKDIQNFKGNCLPKVCTFMPSVKKSVLRYFYKDCNGDSDTAEKCEVHNRVKLFFELEEPYIMCDLKGSKGESKFSVFWLNAKEYLTEDVGVAVHNLCMRF